MGLRESRIINSVHPWFGARLRWMGDVAKLYGGAQSLISGNRTRAEQQRLYDTVTARPVAFPGCSQHQYGFAADAIWNPFVQITSKGRPVLLSQKETARLMNNAARHAGLTVVAGDTGHLQVFNGIEFRNWAVRRGFCNPNPPAPIALSRLIRTNLGLAQDFLNQADAFAFGAINTSFQPIGR